MLIQNRLDHPTSSPSTAFDDSENVYMALEFMTRAILYNYLLATKGWLTEDQIERPPQCYSLALLGRCTLPQPPASAAPGALACVGRCAAAQM
jgi:hypothetical protein